MKWFGGRPPQQEEDLETQWEDFLRGKLGPNKEADLRGEISNSGREEEFESQVEISAYVKKHLDREEPPHRLIAHYEQLAREERLLKNRHARHMLWRGVAGTLAASLALFIVMSGVNVWINRPESYEIVADTSRRLWNRTMLEGLQTLNKDVTIEQIMARFEKKLHYRPIIPLKEDALIDLVRGRVREVSEVKVANVLIRAGEKPVLLSIYRTADYPEWDELQEGEWFIDAQEYPRAVLWRRGQFIYSLTGYAKISTFKEITKRIDPEVLESH